MLIAIKIISNYSIEHLVCAVHCSLPHFYFNPSNKPMKEALLPSFYRAGT